MSGSSEENSISKAMYWICHKVKHKTCSSLCLHFFYPQFCLHLFLFTVWLCNVNDTYTI